MTADELKAKYPTLLMPGLDSEFSYIRLATNPELGVHCAVRLFALRPDDSLLVFGGKVRVAYDSTYYPEVKGVPQAMNAKVAVMNLRTAFGKPLRWGNINPLRASSSLGFTVMAGLWNGALFMDTFNFTELADRMTAQITAEVGCPIDNPELVQTALADIFRDVIPHLFMDLKTPDLSVVPDTPPPDNVVAFPKKGPEGA